MTDRLPERPSVGSLERQDDRMTGWAPIAETEDIPPFGEELFRHIMRYKGGVKHASCSAWKLLYRMLAEYDPGSERKTVSFEKEGKPYFTDRRPFFSISHSRALCAAALSDRPVGVDIELCREHYKEHLIRRCLSDQEMEHFDGDFTRIWCRKEAIAKMTGRGILAYPSFLDTEDAQYRFREQRVSFEGMDYWLVSVTGA